MAMTVRYQRVMQGSLIQIGNTLGLSKASNALTPGTLGSIGAFITTQNISAPGWPINTTLDYTQNSSPAPLSLPAGAVVEYAELIWSASYIVPGSDVSTIINNPITLRDPQGVSYSVTSNGVSIANISLSEDSASSTNYVKSANVTTIVRNGGSGTYICGNVPATMSATANTLQYAGWSLYVAYSVFGVRLRDVIIIVGDAKSTDPPYDVSINYDGPPYTIRMFYSAGEGDAAKINESYRIIAAGGGADTRIGTSVQPPASNPFASQITNQDGQLDTSGPFGTVNQNGIAGTNVSGGRQGWDIGNNVNLVDSFHGSHLDTLRFSVNTNDDRIIVTGNGFIITASQPLATVTKSVNQSLAFAGDTLTYSLVYNFSSVSIPATTIVLVDTVPSGVTYQSGSVVVNGVSQPTFNPNTPGITLGNINVPTIFTVTYRVTANTVINPTTVTNDAYGSFHFQTGGSDFLVNTISNIVQTVVDPLNPVLYKSVDRGFVTCGDTITYTISIPNIGNHTIINATISDTVPNGTIFIPGSVLVNGSTIGGTPSSINVGTIAPGTIKTVSFRVRAQC